MGHRQKEGEIINRQAQPWKGRRWIVTLNKTVFVSTIVYVITGNLYKDVKNIWKYIALSYLVWFEQGCTSHGRLHLVLWRLIFESSVWNFRHVTESARRILGSPPNFWKISILLGLINKNWQHAKVVVCLVSCVAFLISNTNSAVVSVQIDGFFYWHRQFNVEYCSVDVVLNQYGCQDLIVISYIRDCTWHLNFF